GKTEWRLAFRAQIILALADGLTNKEAAGRLATRPATVSKWRGRFARHGLAGVADAPRSGKPRHYDAQDERRILGALDAPPPAGCARWNGTLLGKHLGDISKHQIWRVLREHEISLERRRSWCISTEPAFAQKAADIVALYLQPPEKANIPRHAGTRGTARPPLRTVRADPQTPNLERRSCRACNQAECPLTLCPTPLPRRG